MKKIKFWSIMMLMAMAQSTMAKDVTLPITQVPRWVGYAYATGQEISTETGLDYQLFNQIKVCGYEGEIGTFSTNHGYYISFRFVGGGSNTYYNDSQVSWNETKEMAFYCAWNDNKLSAFVFNRNDGCVYLVDLESDAILASFPIIVYSSYPALSILVFSGALSITAYHGIVINSEGAVNHYKELPTSSVNAHEVEKTFQKGIFNMKGQKVESMEPGINILVDQDGSTTKVINSHRNQ